MFKQFFSISLLTVLILTLMTGLSPVSYAQAKDLTEERGSLQVTGSAVITGTPDIAYITLGVETKDPSAEVASQENAERMNRVFTALQELGLSKEELTTSGYNIYSSNQVVARGTDQESTVTTYHVQNRINISTKDLENVGKIIDIAIKSGANQVQGINFDIQDKQEMQLEALKNAVKQGQLKAEVMAEAAGITLGGIQSFSENYGSYAPTYNTMAMRAEALGSAPTTINPGQVEVSANVSMNFWF